jgi:hypothetical protein
MEAVESQRSGNQNFRNKSIAREVCARYYAVAVTVTGEYQRRVAAFRRLAIGQGRADRRHPQWRAQSNDNDDEENDPDGAGNTG